MENIFENSILFSNNWLALGLCKRSMGGGVVICTEQTARIIVLNNFSGYTVNIDR